MSPSEDEVVSMGSPVRRFSGHEAICGSVPPGPMIVARSTGDVGNASGGKVHDAAIGGAGRRGGEPGGRRQLLRRAPPSASTKSGLSFARAAELSPGRDWFRMRSGLFGHRLSTLQCAVRLRSVCGAHSRPEGLVESMELGCGLTPRAAAWGTGNSRRQSPRGLRTAGRGSAIPGGCR